MDMTQIEQELDSACEHLQGLLDALPAMEEKNKELMRAQQARLLEGLGKRITHARREIDGFQADYDAAQNAVKTAEKNEDEEGVARAMRKMFLSAELIGYRKGPLQRLENEFRDLLSSGTFASEEESRSALLGDEEFTRLTQGIDRFQEDYRTTLERCEKLQDNLDNAQE
ncbi:MAG: hypothetical protein HGA54_01225 [Actinobacteria bacterium]|nr:hypothetical protein [Actinomycetota bacterium]